VPTANLKVVTAAQMTAIEQESERQGVSADTLMETAGLAVAQYARQRLGGAAAARVVILVGPGNNGADGLVAGRRLRRWGAEVTACLLTRRPEVDPKLESARDHGVVVLDLASGQGMAAYDRILARSHLVIDAILGTGRSRPLEGVAREALLRVAEVRQGNGGPPLLALDLPTGLDADAGVVDAATPAMDATLALGFPKCGLLAFPGAERVGELVTLDIGLPDGLGQDDIGLELLTPEWVASQLPPRPLDSHKGTYGHALVVAGSRHYVGAAWLASQASVRTGAGLTTLASPQGVYPIAAAKGAEAIHLPLPEDDSGRIAPLAAAVIRQSERRFTAALAGCGMGWSEGTTEFLRLLLTEAQGRLAGLPILIDADGLNNLSAIENWPAKVNGPLVLTPHPGEMSTLTGLPVAEIQADREEVAREWAGRWGATLVLKGAHTVIASPGEPVRIAPFANPGLATGGTGDVLSGVIVSLLAQGLPPSVAAAAGVYLHAAAGQSVTDRIGQTGLAASDLLDSLPPTIAALHRATPDSAHPPSR